MDYPPKKKTLRQHILMLWKEIRALQPTGDGKTILVQKDPTGTRLQAMPQARNVYYGGYPTGGGVSIAVITQNPNGYGPAVCKKITINPDGSHAVIEPEIAIIVPKL